MVESLLGPASLFFLQGITLLVSFIKNNTFPEPLSKKEEEQYFQILIQSRTTKLNTCEDIINAEHARNKLIEHNLRFVAHLVKRLNFTKEQNEELISVGIIGLINAIDTFDTDKGVRLASYASRCINNEIFMFLRKQKRLQREVSIYDPIAPNKNLIDVLRDKTEPVSERIENKLEQVEVMEDLKRIPELERRVLELRYGLKNGEECPQRKVAEYLRISRSYVSRIEKKAIQSLKNLRKRDSLHPK